MSVHANHAAGNIAAPFFTSRGQMRQLARKIGVKAFLTDQLIFEEFPYRQQRLVFLLAIKTIFHVGVEELRDVDVASCVVLDLLQFRHRHRVRWSQPRPLRDNVLVNLQTIIIAFILLITMRATWYNLSIMI